MCTRLTTICNLGVTGAWTECYHLLHLSNMRIKANQHMAANIRKDHTDKILYKMLQFTSLIIILVSQVTTIQAVCNQANAAICQDTANKIMVAEKCDEALVIQLKNCIDKNINTCVTITQDFWANQISVFGQNLALNKQNGGCIMDTGVTACAAEATELAAITDCTTEFTSNIASIKNGGSTGVNISTYCKAAQASVKCLNNLNPTCVKAITQKNALNSQYTSVDGYCTNPAAVPKSESEGINKTAVIIIAALAILIVLINVVLVVIWLYNRRQKARVKKMPAVRGPMATQPIEYYH